MKGSEKMKTKLDEKQVLVDLIWKMSSQSFQQVNSFIAGMQAQKSMDTFQEPSKMQLPAKPTKENPA